MDIRQLGLLFIAIILITSELFLANMPIVEWLIIALAILSANIALTKMAKKVISNLEFLITTVIVATVYFLVRDLDFIVRVLLLGLTNGAVFYGLDRISTLGYR